MDKPPPVLTKAEFTLRYFAGEFGNASPTWLTLDKFMEWSETHAREVAVGLFHLRNRTVGGATYYKQRWRELVNRWKAVDNLEQWYCSQQVPTHIEKSLLLQGEVMQAPSGHCGLSLYYSQAPLPMRQSLLEGGKQVYGLMASGLLRQHLCPNSYEWLMELLDNYDGHVVEFSSYRYFWGTLAPKFNTVFWETRLY